MLRVHRLWKNIAEVTHFKKKSIFIIFMMKYVDSGVPTQANNTVKSILM